MHGNLARIVPVVLLCGVMGSAQQSIPAGTKAPQVTPPAPQAHQPPSGRQTTVPVSRAAPSPVRAVAYPGTIMGYIYWDAKAVQHNPPLTCNGLAVTVSVGTSASGSTPTFEQFKPLGTYGNLTYVNATYLNGGSPAICAYSVKAPEGQDLQVQVAATPSAFSPVVAPATPPTANNPNGPIKIPGGTCNKFAPSTPSLSVLGSHWWACGDYAYNVNFTLQPSNSVRLMSANPGLLSGSGSAQSASAPASGGLGLSPAPRPEMLASGAPTVMQGQGSSAAIPGSRPQGQGFTDPNRAGRSPNASLKAAAVQRGKLLAGVLRLATGPRITISKGSLRGTDSGVAQILQQQSVEAHNVKSALRAGNLSSTNQIDSMHTEDATGSAQIAGTPTPQIGNGSSQGSFMQRAVKAPPPISMCRFTNAPVIENVSGRLHNIVFTPDPGNGQYPTNQYTIMGCNFGAVQGQVHVFGAFINNPTPVNLGIDSWSDGVILVTFNPVFQNEYDLKNITLAVVRKDGQSVQLPGISFYATRVSRPLARVPRSLIKLPTIYLEIDKFVSPVTNSNLQADGLSSISQSASAVFYVFDPIWSSNVGDGYPQTRLSFVDAIDFSKLHAGFALDPDLQTLVAGGLGSLVGYDSCKYYDTDVSASMQGSSLVVGIQPAECDNSGKFIYAYYGLQLSVTGPKGNLLDPWPSGLQ